MVNEEKANIGSDVIVKRTNSGSIKAVKGTVKLSLRNKDIIAIKGSMVITATGYDKLNQIAGLSLVMPKHIEVPGHGTQPNPFFIIDSETKATEIVMVKMSSVGYSPTGSVCVVDQTLLFNLNSYLKMDAMSKIKGNNGLGRVTGKLSLSEEEKKFGLFLPVLSPEFGIWLDSRHEDFIKILSDAQQRQRFAERIAIGITKRNCLRHHPCIATSIVIPHDGHAMVTVIGHRHDMKESQMRDIVNGDRDGVETICKTIHTDEMKDEPVELNAQDAQYVKNSDKTEDIQGDPIEITEGEKHIIRIDEIRSTITEEEYDKFYNDNVRSGRALSQFSDEELGRFSSILEEFSNTIRQKGK